AAVFFQQVLLQRAAVDADADRYPALGGELDHLLDAPALADVAGIEPEAVHALLERDERQLVIEMDVGDERDANAALDLAELFRCLAHRNGDAHNVAARRLQGPDLVARGARVAGVGLRHRLDGDRGIAANLEITEPDLPGFAPLNHQFFTIMERVNTCNAALR